MSHIIACKYLCKRMLQNFYLTHPTRAWLWSPLTSPMFSLSRLFVQGKYQRLIMHFHPTPRKAMIKIVGVLRIRFRKICSYCTCAGFSVGTASEEMWASREGCRMVAGMLAGTGNTHRCVQPPHTAYHPSLRSLLMFMFLLSPL